MEQFVSSLLACTMECYLPIPRNDSAGRGTLLSDDCTILRRARNDEALPAALQGVLRRRRVVADGDETDAIRQYVGGRHPVAVVPIDGAGGTFAIEASTADIRKDTRLPGPSLAWFDVGIFDSGSSLLEDCFGLLGGCRTRATANMLGLVPQSAVWHRRLHPERRHQDGSPWLRWPQATDRWRRLRAKETLRQPPQRTPTMSQSHHPAFIGRSLS